MIFDLLKDFTDLLEAMPKEQSRYCILQLLNEAVRRDVQFIDRYPTTFFQCMWNTCWWYDCPEATAHYPADGWESSPPWAGDDSKLYQHLVRWRVEKQHAQRGLCWFRSLRPPSSMLGSGLVSSLDSGISGVLSMSGSEELVATSESIIDVQTCKPVAKLGINGLVIDLAFSPVDDSVAVTEYSGTVSLWQVSSPAVGICLATLTDQVEKLTWLPDGKLLAGATRSGGVYLWNPACHQEVIQIPGRRDTINYSIAASPDSRLIAVSRQGGEICLFDVAEHKLVREYHTGYGDVLGIMFTAADTLIGITRNSFILTWSFKEADGRFVLPNDYGPFTNVAFSRDGRWVAASCASQTDCDVVQVWNVQSQKRIFLRKRDAGKISSIVLSSEGNKLIVKSEQKFEIWSIGNSAETVMSCWNHQAYITDLKRSPDGSIIATASAEGIIHLWDSTSGDLLQRVKCGGQVMSVWFSTDGRAVGAFTSRELWWDIVSGNPTTPHLPALKDVNVEGAAPEWSVSMRNACMEAPSGDFPDNEFFAGFYDVVATETRTGRPSARLNGGLCKLVTLDQGRTIAGKRHQILYIFRLEFE